MVTVHSCQKWEIRSKGLWAWCACEPPPVRRERERGNACSDHQIHAVSTEGDPSVRLGTGENEHLRVAFYENKHGFDARTLSCLPALSIEVSRFLSAPPLFASRMIYNLLHVMRPSWAWSDVTRHTYLVQRGTSKHTRASRCIQSVPSVMISEVIFYIRRKLGSLTIRSTRANC